MYTDYKDVEIRLLQTALNVERIEKRIYFQECQRKRRYIKELEAKLKGG